MLNGDEIRLQTRLEGAVSPARHFKQVVGFRLVEGTRSKVRKLVGRWWIGIEDEDSLVV